MKAFKLNYLILFVALVFSSVSVLAQQNNNEDSKDEEVIIIKEIIDEDGNVEVKTITRTGDTEDVVIELEEQEGLSDELQEKLKNIEIEIDEIDKDRHIKIIMDKEGEDGEPIIIEWEGEEEIPEDIQKKMEEHGVIMNGEGHGHFPSNTFFKEKFPKNKACLGVMIGKTVENENGVETVKGESDEGVAILDVFEDSGADEAGLLKDDVITAINGVDVASINDVLDALKPFKGGETVSIAYLRNNQTKLVNATLKTCENKVKMEHFEGHGDNDFEFDEEMNWVFEKKEEGEKQIKRTIVIKKAKKVETEEVQEAETVAGEGNEVAGIDTPDDVIFDSTNDLELQNFSLFPNPTAGNLNIAFQSEAVPTTVKIMDITGKEVYREELNNFNGNYKKEINLSGIPKGPLMLTIMQNDKVFANKVMVQ